MSSQHTVIVGGSSGIGLATARRLIAAGGQVTVTGRHQGRLEEAACQLGSQAKIMVMDATAAEALPGQFAEIGAFDHLVLAAGSGRGVGRFDEVQLADVKLGFEEKVYAHFAAAQAALPFLNQKGSITFVSAIGALAAVAGTAGISSANAAIAVLAPTLAVELKPRRVNAVAPGVIDTPWWDAMPAEQKQAAFADFEAKTPVGRNGRPEDVAQAIAFLIDNSFVTGLVLPVDGGLRFTA